MSDKHHKALLKAIVAALRDEFGAKLEQFLAEQGKPEPWADADEAARHLRCSRQRIYDLVAQAKVEETMRGAGRGVEGRDRAARDGRPPIPYAREGARLLFKRSELDKWVRSRSS